jgi:hypothetical protein
VHFFLVKDIISFIELIVTEGRPEKLWCYIEPYRFRELTGRSSKYMSYLITPSVYMNKRENNSRSTHRFFDVLSDDSRKGAIDGF